MAEPADAHIKPGSWVGQCSACDQEMIRSRVEYAVKRYPGQPLLCGSCRDAERESELGARIAELEAEVERLRAVGASDRYTIGRLSRRPDLTPEQSREVHDRLYAKWEYASEVPGFTQDQRAILAALRTAAEQEGR